MIHAAITAGICALCLILKFPWALFLLPAAFYAGREIAQAEDRYIDSHGGKRDKCPWYCGIKKDAWTTKGILDCVLPLVVSVVFAIGPIFLVR